MNKNGKLTVAEQNAIAGWHHREASKDTFTNYHGFHIQIEESFKTPGKWTMGVWSYYYVTEGNKEEYDTKEEALKEGQEAVDELRKLVLDKAYKLKFNRGFLYGR